jgi:hypothetical protein
MDERRLPALEAQLADSTAILVVDEHTAALLDLDAQLLTVSGRGEITIRSRGRQWTRPSPAGWPTHHRWRAAPMPPPRRRRNRSRSRRCPRWSTAPQPRSTTWSNATPTAWWP